MSYKRGGAARSTLVSREPIIGRVVHLSESIRSYLFVMKATLPSVICGIQTTTADGVARSGGTQYRLDAWKSADGIYTLAKRLGAVLLV